MHISPFNLTVANPVIYCTKGAAIARASWHVACKELEELWELLVEHHPDLI